MICFAVYKINSWSNTYKGCMKEELEKEMKPCLEKKNFFLKREREIITAFWFSYYVNLSVLTFITREIIEIICATVSNKKTLLYQCFWTISAKLQELFEKEICVFSIISRQYKSVNFLKSYWVQVSEPPEPPPPLSLFYFFVVNAL